MIGLAGNNVAAAASQFFLKQLKNDTQSDHQSLESVPLLANLMSEEVSLELYHNYLDIMLTIHRQFEQHVQPALLVVIPELTASNASADIERDLSHLSRGTDKDFSIHRHFRFGASTVAEALGTRYVLEGSKLGGKFIFRHLSRCLSLPKERASYLLDDQRDTGANWKDFLTTLSGYALQYNCQSEVIAGAGQAFRSIHSYITSNSAAYAI